jgi:hypothetical protein
MWSELGASSWEQSASTSVVELEPLIAFTAVVGVDERRLLAQAIDWCVGNAELVSLHQLRRVVSQQRWPFKGPIAEFGATAGHFMRKQWPGVTDERPFLRSLPGKSREPDLTKPTLIALRFRAIFGVGARSEILRFLLFHPWPHTAQEIAEEVPYGARQISKDLHLLSLAGTVRSQPGGPRSGYAIGDVPALVGIVGKPSARVVPWASLFRVLTALIDALTDLAARDLRDADTEVARRLRLMERELRRLASEDWWTQPEKTTVDDIAAWMPWLIANVTQRV